MKSLKILLAVLVLCAPFYAQTPGQTTKVRTVTALPSTCVAGDMVVVKNDATYDCPNGSWQKIGAGGSVPDADATTKGKLQLTGDLGGTAASPTTPTALHQTGDETAAGKKTIDEVRTKYGPEINVKAWGADGDGGWYPAVSCVSGSATISSIGSLGGRFPRAGDTITVSGCGAAGADLTCTLASATGTNFGTATCGGGVTAGATLSSRGGRWGSSVDDTAAFQAAINYCATAGSNGGCRIIVPPGVYFISTVTFPAASGKNYGQIILRGSGRWGTWLIGIGADQTPILKAPASSVSTWVEALGFQSYDYTTKRSTAIQWLGGTEHTFTNNTATNVYEMLNASNTWINVISNNRCYVVTHCIEFGASGTGPVNATFVQHNELSNWGATGHAIYTHTNNASYGNTIGPNSVEDSNQPFGEAYDLSDNFTEVIGGYWEIADSTSGYAVILRGNRMTFRSASLPCMQITGSNATVIGSVIGACTGQTYMVKNDGSANTFIGVTEVAVSTLNSTVVVGGTGAGSALSVGSYLKAYPYLPATAYAWPNGRVDIASTPFARSNSVGGGPVPALPYPNQFDTAATVPLGTVVINTQNFSSSGDTRNNLGWQCISNPCATNPINGAQWVRWGERAQKVRTESTTAPSSASFSWAIGDWVWKTNPSANGIIAWYCTTAGNPCANWAPVYGIDVASPPAWGGTTPAAVTGTTINATTKYQLAGVDLLDTDGTLAGNSDTKVATQKATKTYADTKIPSSAKLATGASIPTTDVTAPGAEKCAAWDSAGKLIVSSTNAACGSGGSMTWPGTAGIAVYSGSSSWGTSLTAPTGAIVGTTDTQALTNKDLSGAGNTFPTFNQNTTGSAAKWTTARNLAGNSVDGSANVAFANKFIVQGTTDAGLSGAQFLGALGTGLVKNTTTTGVLSIAASGTDYAPATSGTSILKGNGSGGFSAAVAGTDYAAANASTTVNTQSCALGGSCTVTADPTSAQYKTFSCQPGLGDGLNAVPAGTYLQSTCYNDTGVTVTITGIKCFTDNAGTSALSVTNGAGTALLTGAVTCSASFAAGTQSATTTIASGDYLKFSWVADGTSKQTTWVVTFTK